MSEGILGLKKYFQERNVFLGANTENKKIFIRNVEKANMNTKRPIILFKKTSYISF